MIRLVIKKLILILIVLLQAHLVIATLLLSAGHLRIANEFVIRLKHLNASKRYLARGFLDTLQVCLVTVHVTLRAYAIERSMTVLVQPLRVRSEEHLLFLSSHLLLCQ